MSPVLIIKGNVIMRKVIISTVVVSFELNTKWPISNITVS